MRKRILDGTLLKNIRPLLCEFFRNHVGPHSRVKMCSLAASALVANRFDRLIQLSVNYAASDF
jgi:hypothetical protein